ncbi:MAG: hypothetical protein MN733_42120, partial [Nitrososphaera sp.]|nr:hypothetical protein [Nitrososphaera sp.]
MAQQSAIQSSLAFQGSSFNAAPFLKASSAGQRPYYVTDLGLLFEGDCLEILPTIEDECVDTVFADPPYNLNKSYGPRSNDNLPDTHYISWCHSWIDECIRVLTRGGALFIYNLPKWNLLLGAYLINAGMEFRHSIAVDIKNCLPIPG